MYALSLNATIQPARSEWTEAHRGARNCEQRTSMHERVSFGVLRSREQPPAGRCWPSSGSWLALSIAVATTSAASACRQAAAQAASTKLTDALRKRPINVLSKFESGHSTCAHMRIALALTRVVSVYRRSEIGKTEVKPEQRGNIDAAAPRSTTVQGVVALEKCVLEATSLVGTVLRYGQIYGPGTGADEPSGTSPVHVQAAAVAALLVLQRSKGGVYNIAQDDAEVRSEKAKRELGWSPSMRSADSR